MSKQSPLARTFLLMMPMFILPVIWILSGTGMFDGVVAKAQNRPHPWPPVIGQAYPDLTLIDQEGQEFKLSYLKGKVIVVEPIGMNCPACQAFAGGNKYGAFENNAVARDLNDFKTIFLHYSKGLRLPNPDVVFVQILLYDMNMGAPTKEDARKWAAHFNISKDNNHFVAVFPYDMRGKESFDMIPGFQLIDRNFILKSDSTGHHPKHNLYKQLIPLTPKLVAEKVK